MDCGHPASIQAPSSVLSSSNTRPTAQQVSNHVSKSAQFALHMPLPPMDCYQAERNQRFVMIYGFGAKRNEIVKKTKGLQKDLLKIFAKKSSIDLGEARLNVQEKLFGAVDAENQSALFQRYTTLPYYDQYQMSFAMADHVLTMLKACVAKTSNVLPSINSMLFMFDLMESSCNVFQALQYAIKILKVVPQLEKSLLASNPASKWFLGQYMAMLHFNIIGVLRLHLSCLILWQDLTIQVFRRFFCNSFFDEFILNELFLSLYRLVKHVETPRKCTSIEKTSLVFMNELYASCPYLKVKKISNMKIFKRILN